jgi:hypothetical protein
MSKIHQKTGSACIICDDPLRVDKNNKNVLKLNYIVFHKTRRQTHAMCDECAVGYLKPLLRIACNNIRKNIKKNIDIIKCPGSYYSEKRNQCCFSVRLSSLIIKNELSISIDIFKINYVLTEKNSFLCLDEKCGQVVDVDNNYNNFKLSCPGCKYTWCRQCLVQPFHYYKTCIQYEMDNKSTDNAKFIWNMKDKGLLKFCPQCKVPTEKNTGCNKLICSSWLCSRINIDYDHYNNTGVGGCSGKLWKTEDYNVLN